MMESIGDWSVEYYLEDETNVGFRIPKADLRTMTTEDIEDFLLAVRRMESDILDVLVQRKREQAEAEE